MHYDAVVNIEMHSEIRLIGSPAHIPISLEFHTRGISLKVVNRRCHYDLRECSFCNKVTNI